MTESLRKRTPLLPHTNMRFVGLSVKRGKSRGSVCRAGKRFPQLGRRACVTAWNVAVLILAAAALFCFRAS